MIRLACALSILLAAMPVKAQPPPPDYGYGGPPGGYPPPGYPPPEPPPGPSFPPGRPPGFRCEAGFPTPYGLRRVVCGLPHPLPQGAPCYCPPPPQAPGYPPAPPAHGYVAP